jgi:hypothetical protein
MGEPVKQSRYNETCRACQMNVEGYSDEEDEKSVNDTLEESE